MLPVMMTIRRKTNECLKLLHHARHLSCAVMCLDVSHCFSIGRASQCSGRIASHHNAFGRGRMSLIMKVWDMYSKYPNKRMMLSVVAVLSSKISKLIGSCTTYAACKIRLVYCMYSVE